MSSIFDLKTSAEELKSRDGSVSSFKYEEYNPNRDVTNGNFSRSQFAIPFELSSTQWWVPSRSYIRMRCDLTASDGTTALEIKDSIGPNMNLAANLFSSMELQLNGKTISRCSDNVSAVDTLEQRLHKSKAWMDSIGASVNWLQESVNDRINQVSNDGVDVGEQPDIITMADLGITDPTKYGFGSNFLDTPITAGDISIKGGYVQLHKLDGTSIQDVLDKINSYDLKAGDIIATSTSQYIYQGSIDDTDVATGKLEIEASLASDEGWNGQIHDVAFQIIRKSSNHSRRVKSFEIIWKPLCLSIFKYSGALPVGKYRLICTPHNDSGGNMQMKAVETPKWKSTTTDPTGNFKFTVTDCRFYCAQVEGMRVDDTEYYLNLENTRVQTKLMTSTTNSLAKNDFTVEPLTYALTVAFRDNKAGNDTRYSNSRFVVGNNDELKLNRMYISYAGKQFPQPDADPKFDVNVDNTTQRYIETSTNTGALFSEGGGESLVEWQKRGSIHYFSTPKDGNDRSTRCTVNTQFKDTVNECNLLLFSHSSASLKVTIQNGLCVDAQVIEA